MPLIGPRNRLKKKIKEHLAQNNNDSSDASIGTVPVLITIISSLKFTLLSVINSFLSPGSSLLLSKDQQALISDLQKEVDGMPSDSEFLLDTSHPTSGDGNNNQSLEKDSVKARSSVQSVSLLLATPTSTGRTETPDKTPTSRHAKTRLSCQNDYVSI